MDDKKSSLYIDLITLIEKIADHIIPKENEADLEEIDPVVKEKVSFIPVTSFSQVVPIAIVDVPVISEKQWNAVADNTVTTKSENIRQ